MVFREYEKFLSSVFQGQKGKERSWRVWISFSSLIFRWVECVSLSLLTSGSDKSCTEHWGTEFHITGGFAVSSEDDIRTDVITGPLSSAGIIIPQTLSCLSCSIYRICVVSGDHRAPHPFSSGGVCLWKERVAHFWERVPVLTVLETRACVVQPGGTSVRSLKERRLGWRYSCWRCYRKGCHGEDESEWAPAPRE